MIPLQGVHRSILRYYFFLLQTAHFATSSIFTFVKRAERNGLTGRMKSHLGDKNGVLKRDEISVRSIFTDLPL